MNADYGMVLLGVGGGGCQAVAAARRLFGDSLRALGLDTDPHALGGVEGLRGMLLGGPRLAGMGTGGDPVKGRLAMQDNAELLKRELDGVRIAVVVTALGGGTGGGATPELLRMLRQTEITTLCFALLPFAFEPAERRRAAERALPQLDENADTVVVVPQDDLWKRAGAADAALAVAAQEASRQFGHGLTLLWRLLLMPGFIRFDPARLRAVLSSRGRARFHLSEAVGPDRAQEAAASLLAQANKPGAGAPARACVLGILAADDLRLAEVDRVMRTVTAALPGDCRLDMGTTVDSRCEGTLCLIALVFDTWSEASAGGAAAAAAAPSGLPALAKGGGRARGAKTSKLGYNTGRGRFRDIEATIFNGEDLDIPTFVRKHITL